LRNTPCAESHLTCISIISLDEEVKKNLCRSVVPEKICNNKYGPQIPRTLQLSGTFSHIYSWCTTDLAPLPSFMEADKPTNPASAPDSSPAYRNHTAASLPCQIMYCTVLWNLAPSLTSILS